MVYKVLVIESKDPVMHNRYSRAFSMEKPDKCPIVLNNINTVRVCLPRNLVANFLKSAMSSSAISTGKSNEEKDERRAKIS